MDKPVRKPLRATRPRRKGLSDVIFDRLSTAIKSGAYEKNEGLPTEHELAREFQVSRPVVREALQRLKDQGLIYSRRGAGSFVRSPGLKKPVGFGELESLTDLSNCYEFRITLEPRAAAAAAERRDDAQLADIAAALKQMRDATARDRHREDADFAFHSAIARASGNSYFAKAMESLKEHIAVGMQMHGRSVTSDPDGLSHVYDEHCAIFEAIRDQDAHRAGELMEAHLSGSRQRLFDRQAQKSRDTRD